MTKLIGFIVVCYLPLACSSSDDSGTGAGSTTDLCDTLCNKENECDNTVDVQTCSKSCESSFASREGKFRAQFLDSIGACYGSRDCASILAGGALGACAEEAEAGLAPSEQGTSFCDKYAATVEKCSGTFDKAACLSFAKTSSDPALREAQACLGKVCSAVSACVEATL